MKRIRLFLYSALTTKQHGLMVPRSALGTKGYIITPFQSFMHRRGNDADKKVAVLSFNGRGSRPAIIQGCADPIMQGYRDPQ